VSDALGGGDDERTREWHVWGEWLDLHEAEAVATHTGDLAEGVPAVARNAVGDGTATYCGVWPDADLAAALVDGLLGRAGVATTDRLPPGVRINRRGDLTWVSNFTSTRYRVVTAGEPSFAVGDATLDAFDACAVRTPIEAVEVVPERRASG
jgi:beta-galactosidase